MAKHNRHLRGATEEIDVSIAGRVAVDAGDLMYLDTVAGMNETGAAATLTGMPFDYGQKANDASASLVVTHILYDNFLGVAMETSPLGVTEFISVATAGVFRMPLSDGTGVTIGSKVSAVSPVTALNISATNVGGESSAGATSAYLGWVTKSGASSQTYVEFELQTKSNRTFNVNTTT